MVMKSARLPILGFICCNAVLLLIAFWGRNSFDLVTWMSIIQLVLTLCVMIWAKRKFLLVGVIFLALTYLFHFGQSLITTLGFNDIYAHRSVVAKTSLESYVTAELFSMTSIFFVGVGYLFINQPVWPMLRKKQSEGREATFSDEAILEIRIVALLIFFITVIPMAYVDMGKILAVIAGDYLDTYAVYKSGIAKYFYTIGQFARPAVTVLIFTYIKKPRKALVILVTSTLYYLIVMLSGDRGTGMIYLIANFFVYFKYVKALKVRYVLIGAVVCYLLMAFLSAISIFRYSEFSFSSFIDVFLRRSHDGIVYSFLREFGSTMISLVYAVDYIPSYMPYAYGLTYVAGLLTVSPAIPDAWAEALTPFFSFVRAFPVEVQGSLGGSFLGELYYNFGWFGAAFASLVGVLLGYADREMHPKKSPYVITVILVLLPVLLLWVRDFYCSLLFQTFWFSVALFVFHRFSIGRKKIAASKEQHRITDCKHALIITTDKFPQGNAGATRQEALSKLMVQCGYAVDVIGLGQGTDFAWKELLPRVRYISLRGDKQTLLNRVLDRLLFAVRACRICERCEKYDAILIESVPAGLISYVKWYAKKHGTMILHDSVEWYSASEFKSGKMDPAYINKELNNCAWISAKFRVIAISTYLKAHFLQKGCRCECIPFIHDVQNIHPLKKNDENKLVFLYAGMMGRKDHLGGFLKAVAALEDVERQRIEIRLFGFQRSYLIDTGNADERLLEELKDQIKLYGRVPRQTVEQNLLEADFSLLFRDPAQRYAKAGFPTKVVESMSHATPVFCNLSSDLGEYLVDGENSVLCASESVEDISAALRRTLALTAADKAVMQKNARECALKNFDYRGYEAELRRLLEE